MRGGAPCTHAGDASSGVYDVYVARELALGMDEMCSVGVRGLATVWCQVWSFEYAYTFQFAFQDALGAAAAAFRDALLPAAAFYRLRDFSIPMASRGGTKLYQVPEPTMCVLYGPNIVGTSFLKRNEKESKA